MNERAQRLQRRLEWPILVAALLTVPAIALEEAGASGTPGDVAVALNWISWTAFVTEAALMLSVVDDRRRWIREHPLEVAIIVLTPPFLPASLQAARVFRLLRLLPLLRAALLVRRLMTTEGVRDAAVLAVLTVLGGGAAYAAVEKTAPSGEPITAWDGVWWAITTVTTVGYGDNYPATTSGRLIAVCVMLVGIGFVAIVTAAAAGRFTRSHQAAEAERADLAERLDAIAARLEAIEQHVRPGR